jgi:hypothetical protein
VELEWSQIRKWWGLNRSDRARSLPWGIHICAILDKEFNDLYVAPGTSSMEREDAIDNRVDWLAA